MAAKSSPFAVLANIDKRSRALSKGLPAQEEAVELWHGIGFMLDGKRYVAPMGEVVEILHIPRYTQVPGVKPFMLGAANVRGRLLPVIELASFVDLPRSSRAQRDRRVLVVEQDDIFCGLIVDAVLGMQYFAVGSFTGSNNDAEVSLQPFLRGTYLRNDEQWAVFSMVELVEDERFLDAAVW